MKLIDKQIRWLKKHKFKYDYINCIYIKSKTMHIIKVEDLHNAKINKLSRWLRLKNCDHSIYGQV